MAVEKKRYLSQEELPDGGEQPPVDASAPQKTARFPDIDQKIRAMRMSTTPAYLPEYPLSANAINYLESSLPERLDNLSWAQRQEQAAALMNGVPYTLGSFLDRGAESVLYNAQLNGFSFCVKSIRNWKDRWFGDSRNKSNQGKLQNVSYKTKWKHLSNEYRVGQMICNNSVEGLGSQIPVSIFSLRKVTTMGLELGWDLLMERINGVDLATKMLQNSMSLTDKIGVCLQICKAISQFHSRNLIHLDIKPSNFMVERTGRVRLIDFGISVPAGYQKKTVAGTAGFMSPEQICRAQLGPDTDVFALGVTFAILFGAKPLSQDPNDAVQRDYRRTAAHDMEKSEMPALGEIPELAGAAYRNLAEVIRKCTIMRRDRRIANCMMLGRQLRTEAENCGLLKP